MDGVRYSGETNEPIAGSPGGGDDSLTVGNAYNAVLEEQAYLDAGEEVPKKVSRRAQAARHVLNTKRTTLTPTGLQSHIPGVPKFDDAPPDPGGVQEAPGGGGDLTMEVPKVSKKDTKLPLATLGKIIGLLDSEPEEFWAKNTGTVGTAKRLGGGFAREFGVSVSPKANKLHRQFEILKGQMVEILLNEEGRISDQDRERLDRIVGGVEPGTDITELWEGIADMVDFIGDVESRQ